MNTDTHKFCIFVVACWFYSFFPAIWLFSILFLSFSLPLFFSATLRFNSIVKITHKGFHRSLCSPILASNNSFQSFTDWNVLKELALIYTYFIIFFVHTQSRTNFAHSIIAHTCSFISSFTLWLAGCLSRSLSFSLYFSTFFPFFLIHYCAEGSVILWFFTYKRIRVREKKCGWNENTSSPRML